MSSEQSESKLIRNLRKEIIKLKRENAQLKKRNSRIENDWAEFVANQDEEENYVPADPKRKKRITCAKCGSYSITEFILAEKEYYKCEDCNAKGRID